MDRTKELAGTKTNQRSSATYRAIDAVCLKLLDRKTPIRPTAKLVSDVGGANDPDFPAISTLFNQYSDVLSIWREAYYQLKNIDTESGLPLEELILKDIDDSMMDEGNSARLRQIIALSKELLQRNNALKEIITKTIPVNLDAPGENDDEFFDVLLNWLQSVVSWGFIHDDAGLKVSRSTSAGTLIMDAYLFEGLKSFAQKAKAETTALAITRPK
ncbi:hypothetical protein [Sinorhizobium meliloti]|uniref:hypothetical protein n=1 Tax=Rhizobium meliloti TaxID=382 RepID=UPI000FD76AA1|nr:hypothetical protein [Sinorhizobium meliloti]RVN37947.1 hypothetical protein CN118_14330 [Sinorhizobium meliloti]